MATSHHEICLLIGVELFRGLALLIVMPLLALLKNIWRQTLRSIIAKPQRFLRQ